MARVPGGKQAVVEEHSVNERYCRNQQMSAVSLHISNTGRSQMAGGMKVVVRGPRFHLLKVPRPAIMANCA